MSDDAIARLGYIALGSRLKRLGEQLQAGVAEALSQRGFDVHPGQLPVLVAIDEADEPSVAELATMLGVAQPGISRTLGTLQRTGLVTLGRDEGDARTRRVFLTDRARSLLEEILGDFAETVGTAAAEVCHGLHFLEVIGIVEARIREIPFVDRMKRLYK